MHNKMSSNAHFFTNILYHQNGDYHQNEKTVFFLHAKPWIPGGVKSIFRFITH